MSQMSAPPQSYVQAVPQYVMMPIRERNGLGVFGFLVALIGIFVPTGIVSFIVLKIIDAVIGLRVIWTERSVWRASLSRFRNGWWARITSPTPPTPGTPAAPTPAFAMPWSAASTMRGF